MKPAGIALILILAGSSPAHADSFDGLLKQRRDNFDSLLKSAEDEGKEKDKMMDEVWEQKKREFDRLWEERKKEIEKKWDEALRSTKKEWVDYSKDDEARSIVNFEKGYVEIAAVIPADNPDIVKSGAQKIQEQFKKIYSDANETGKNPLEGQIAASDSKDFAKKEIVKSVKADREPIIPKDGIKRIVVKVRLELLPDHISIRAKQFIPSVSRYSDEIDVPPELIMSIIHTESYFNPMAQSPAYAFGLMQLIPRYGARDAHRFLFKEDRIVEPSYLLVPDNNIRMGTAYLYILLNRTYGNITDPLKQTYVSVCAYNWGPTGINNIIKKNNIGSMGHNDLFDLLRQKTPKETSDYLDRVTKRMEIYKPLFN